MKFIINIALFQDKFEARISYAYKLNILFGWENKH
jgi:hypothetical protein